MLRLFAAKELELRECEKQPKSHNVVDAKITAIRLNTAADSPIVPDVVKIIKQCNVYVLQMHSPNAYTTLAATWLAIKNVNGIRNFFADL